MEKTARVMAIIAALAIVPSILAVDFIASQFTAVAPQIPSPVLEDQLKRQTDGEVRISYHAGTGKVRFIGTDVDKPLRRPPGLGPTASPEQTALQFLTTYGEIFGLTDPSRQLRTVRTTEADRGRTFVRLQQVHSGVPVLGGELIVQSDEARNVVSVDGEVLPDIVLDVAPAIAAEAARQQALEMVASTYLLPLAALRSTTPELWIYNPVILGGSGPRFSQLVWRVEVQPIDPLPIDEMVLVDARIGAITLHFDQIGNARNRRIYDNRNSRSNGLPGNGPVRSEGQAATGISDVDRAYDHAGDVYDFYKTVHGRDSVDNRGMALVSTVRYCSDYPWDDCPYENAFWNGQQMVYGAGFSVDDVVAHELTHGVTQNESKLFYYMQSGAISESFSDVWGEFIDLSNGAGNDAPDVRWKMGEDLPVGAVRSMSDPPEYRDPDKITSPYYWCDEMDQGGVHINSGVGNKTAYLVADGGYFNGWTVVGLGITKTSKIWYEAQSVLLTSAADYQDLYDLLQQACVNLVGTNGITAGDCQQVRTAVNATEMNLLPRSCGAASASVCPTGQSAHNIFFDDLENPASGRWQSGALSGINTWYYPQPSSLSYAASGQYHFLGRDQSYRADFYIAMMSDISLPGGSTPNMHFNHAFDFVHLGPTFLNGGVVEYSTNGGVTWTDAASLFVENGYVGTIDSGGDNPLAGRRGFVALSYGYYSSRLDLSSLAGQNVRFRFRIGAGNTGFSSYGWFIDDVRLYTCSSGPAPTATVNPNARKLYLPSLLNGH
ncbi:MAG: M4 family metallopeptidase [Chloroflexi bacterium]|nr:M4 family metallopeptidase [Chloroflexota bacterium]